MIIIFICFRTRLFGIQIILQYSYNQISRIIHFPAAFHLHLHFQIISVPLSRKRNTYFPVGIQCFCKSHSFNTITVIPLVCMVNNHSRVIAAKLKLFLKRFYVFIHHKIFHTSQSSVNGHRTDTSRNLLFRLRNSMCRPRTISTTYSGKFHYQYILLKPGTILRYHSHHFRTNPVIFRYKGISTGNRSHKYPVCQYFPGSLLLDYRCRSNIGSSGSHRKIYFIRTICQNFVTSRT